MASRQLSIGLIFIWGVSAFIFGAGSSKYFAPEVLKISHHLPLKEDRSPISIMFGTKSTIKKDFNLSEMRVIGLIAGGSRSTVLVSFSGSTPRTLTMGIVERDGWTLENIEKDVITLSNYGATFELPYNPKKTGLQSMP